MDPQCLIRSHGVPFRHRGITVILHPSRQTLLSQSVVLMMADVGIDGTSWLLYSLRASYRTANSGSTVLPLAGTPRLPFDDPERLRYLLALIQHILDGRRIVSFYNVAVVSILILLTVTHVYGIVTLRHKQRAIESLDYDNAKYIRRCNSRNEVSPSSLVGASPPSQTGGQKLIDADAERQPLLDRSRRKPQSVLSVTGAFAYVRSWLMYQPQPVPFVNRQLPSNGTSLFVAGYFGLNVFFHLYRLPLESKYFFAFADRAGCVFIVNLPILYLLSAKNQPLSLLTGRSYEALNIFHRRVGELMCFEALVHVGGMVFWKFCLEPEWFETGTLWEFFTHPLILLGIGAFLSYEALYFTSLASFRERWYELFLASHVILQVTALCFLWLHFHTSRPYVLAALAIFILDRAMWRLWLKSVTVAADIKVLEDGDTVLLSANWDIPSSQGHGLHRFPVRNIIHGWHPANHIFISIPSLGGSNALRAHPFTIASAAPDRSLESSHAWLNLLIRAHSGFTLELLRYAHLNSTVSVRMDGPYGSEDPLRMLQASKVAVLIAGGSGIAVIFPLLWHLTKVQPGHRKIHLMWVLHSACQRLWIPDERLAELRLAGVHITLPRPTVEVGRPDLAGYIADIVASSSSNVGIVVSGPDGFNRNVRNACSRAVRNGIDINLRVEKFGW
ncbi:hypothetical protein GGS20DRAFT_569715 [Poronia punctata]|nr:hypothetical protein GGS20DRAFT_569715 [Poronia punctata]